MRRTGEAAAGCGIRLPDGRPCSQPVQPDSPLNLCTRHLLDAHDWVTSDVGVTDLLPSACAACGSRVGVKYPSGWICAICEWRVGDVPDVPVAAVRVDVVYYIRLESRIKIGTSSNPRSRIASLPHDEVLAFERGTRVREQVRHAQFASHRIRGSEWFESHPALLEHIALLTEGVDDPWARYALWVSQEVALRG
jgi:hypothetical protein